jgi:hypothetical protein
LKATIHNLNGGNIVCNECHNSHNNDALNVNGGNNVDLIGLTIDYNSDPALNLASPQIRKERVATGLGALQDVVFELSPNDWDRTEIDNSGDGLGICNACHGDATTPIHNRDQDCTGCHAHDSGFVGSGDCRACHDGTGLSDAEKVSVDSPHSTNTLFTSIGVTFTCENCHTAHNAGNVLVPNNSTVGINYNSAGHIGISLGADGTEPNDAVGNTEAEICWNCHALYGVSEWGTTTYDSNGAFPNFNYGSLNQDNWVGATWTSANFQYKTDLIQSTHAANATDGVAGVDAVGDIRCSYCHDVHDLNAATGDTLSGSPYLRGSWMGNPYREDGAPRWDVSGDQHSYNQLQAYGAVPRGNRDQYSDLPTTSKDGDTVFRGNEMGGYWIDQNSGFPTQNPDYDTVEEVAGLCELCHGGGGGNTKGDGIWAATEIDNIDQFTVDNNWIGTNGHANSVVGGTGSSSLNAANIFTNVKRGNPQTSIVASQFDGWNLWDRTGMGYFGQKDGNRLWGIRNNDEKSWFWSSEDLDSGVFPPSENPDGVDVRYTYVNFEWGNDVTTGDPILTQDDSTIDDRYHQFTCSKCHNPHASRLPRLMISNCLDVRNNTWDNQTTFTEAAQDGTAHTSGAGFDNEGYSGDTYWTGGANGPYTALVQSPGVKELAYAYSAQNCHRAVDATTGWNTITPPNSPGGPWP